MEHYIRVKGSAWRLAMADVHANGSRCIVYGAWDEALRCVDPRTGELLWEIELGGFPVAVAAADVNGDGRDEAFAACTDGRLYAVDAGGRLLWTFQADLPLYCLQVAKLLPDTGLQVACGGVDRAVHVLDAAGELQVTHYVTRLANAMAAADFDGDGIDELVVIDNRNCAELLRFSHHWKWGPPGVERRVWKHLTVPEDLRNWENPACRFYAFYADAGDLDGDGLPEVVLGDSFFNKQPVLALDTDLSDLWISENVPWRHDGNFSTEFYSATFVRIIPDPVGGDEGRVLSVAGSLVRMHDARGKLLGRAVSRLGFTDVVVDGTTMYLGSTPNGDETIYRIDLALDWQAQVAGLERRGLPARIGESIEDLRRAVLAGDWTASAPRRVYPVQPFNLRSGRRPETLMQLQDRVRWWQAQTPYDCLRFQARTKAIEPTPPLDENGDPWSLRRWGTDSINGTMTVGEIVECARRVEQSGVPTIFTVGHSCMPFITLETAARIIDAAPTWLDGFITCEDEDLERIPRYYHYWFGPLMDMCAKRGLRCTTKNKHTWYVSTTAKKSVFDDLFAPGRRDSFGANVEDSGSRTPELNIMGRFGLWLAGLIPPFDVTIISDLHCWNRHQEWEYPRHGHPYLRLLVAHTVLGGGAFESRILSVLPDGDGMAFSELGRESIELFLHMLGRGLVFTPDREQVIGHAPVGIAMHEPPANWFLDAHNGWQPMMKPRDPSLEDAVIPHNGCTWGNTRTPAHALQRVLFNKTRQFGQHVPATPYGPVAFVPCHAELGAVPGVDEWWHTDGVEAWQGDGPRLRGMPAADAVRRTMTDAAARVAFLPRGDDVFLQALRLAEDYYRLYLLDPGWLDPADRRVSVAVQCGSPRRVWDTLTGDALALDGNRLELDVPAGTMRIMDLET